MTGALPIIDVGAFSEKRGNAVATAREIGKACREFGFFYATGHGVEGETVHALKEASARFCRRGSRWRSRLRAGDVRGAATSR
jgi:isopenicillin N synthase-like dioxygenase